MMQEKIVAEPSLPEELIDRTIALDTTAGQIMTLVDCCYAPLHSLKDFATRHGGGEYAEWQRLRHLLSLIEQKAEEISDVAVAVRNA